MLTIKYYNKDELSTEIYVNEEMKSIEIKNFTEHLMSRAFGINETPSWENFNEFLKSRCFPENRQHVKLELKRLGLNEYDPLAICKATSGRNYKDSRWMQFEYEREVDLDENNER